MFLKFIYFSFYFILMSCQEWTYRDMESWRRDFDSCGGRRQSPINIDSFRLRRNRSLRLDVNAYETPQTNVILRNTGHSAELTLNSRNPSITIGVGPDYIPYVFQNMHFHWGNNNFKGTEHSVDNSFGSAELHFVHYNQKYGSFSAALNRRDGIVVVTVLLQLSRENNRALPPIIRSLPQVIRSNTSTVIQRFNFGALLPRNRELFFSYAGSLTTPPCTETVTFMIFADPIGISAIQVSQLRRLFEESNPSNRRRLVSNRRDIQPLNGRVVEVSVPRSRTSFSAEPEPNDETFINRFDNDIK